MPKRKTDPIFAEAAKLSGFAKVQYLAGGNLDNVALDAVEWIKTAALLKGTGSGCNDERDDAVRVIENAIRTNDASFFRQVADVLDQQKLNVERPVKTQFGPWVSRNASHPLATDIAIWDWMRGANNASEGPLFSELWNHLEAIPRYRARFRKMTLHQIESEQSHLRRTAKAIGIVFLRDKKGPK